MRATTALDALVQAVFTATESPRAFSLLESRCGNNLPFIRPDDLEYTELVFRIQCAALKASGGKMDRLESAVALAEKDWRDLLVGEGFGNSLTAHRHWANEQIARSCSIQCG
jgi:hypothetical protein